ncbi:bifunctional DNA-formamidopyrimidine glycosylase/DNA-(apurinic or apyrimidinic site) lyase [Aestuariimicrobium ganziense]|uniref:bifunctional DNA-formamidopyrimidine glycosylase/DNA-(apurinic or apyrimidinic site) lyase n=1 Tax=Aestuariimicrobium ganziense TaxID=2773677 RepID=UPI0019429885|nr:bifunctional DNA-formamidopyrimidine glycosylase/DNA-(apurinic or apyrimidinic site) lyase [Aestuariimicrobium ganziense]
MPELPEVESVRLGLAAHLVGRTTTAITVLHPRPVRSDPLGPDHFASLLTGRTFTEPRRRGKYLGLPFADGDAMLAHLGMSGQFRVDGPGDPLLRNTRVLFDLDDGRQLRLVDQRMFGGLALSPGGAEFPDEYAHVAPDLLEEAFDRDAVVARIRSKDSGIKRILLDQRVISGLGNIYVDESLWRAQVHYDRPGRQLTRAAAGGLLDHARNVLLEALEAGGTSFDALYVNVNGESGYFARSLHAYGREEQPCDRCGTPIRREAFMNRSSFFCPRCQRAPRKRRT